MRSLFIAVVALLAVSGTAFGADMSAVTREVSLQSRQSSVPKFNLVGLHWQGPGTVLFLTRSTTGRWSVWRTAAPEDEDGPDGGRERSRPGWRIGNPYWTGASN